MSENEAQLTQGVREVLLQGPLAGENPEDLGDDTPLITSGVLDSVRTAQLVADLEDRFGIAFEAFEMSVDYLDTVALIRATIQAKLP